MSAPAHLADGKLTNYGMGLAADEHEGHERVAHGGGTNGSVTSNSTYPDDKLNIIVLENSLRGDPNAIESAVLESIYPDALAAARMPAKGEDLGVRPRVVRLIDQLLSGTLPASELSPAMQHVLSPDRQKASAAHFETFGPPIAVIFKGSQENANGTTYVYRIQFAHADETFVVVIDKTTGVVDGMTIRPAG
jgi:hypothetical protein